ncbi:hypothetical protein VHA01S_036_00130 [Vibrio halioticoli NBRC 102217]|uniref:ABM domain-containing protein n=1 Tax=Vibrio halioticoli NBRC 102217 TaxID=1219072 RepID=V5FER6_9VIBR|nr:antibiotic biosynthesis monooxygenase [Vibrio halioticoli]GAD90208.1 hypothetical protein VHA01S_036_00130 [Vibrio halioticoli NBRC 102217]
MAKVILSGYIIVPDKDLDAVLHALPEHIRLTQAECGNMTFRVQQSADTPQRFDVYEEFIDKPSFEFHQRRVKDSFWGKVTADVSRHYDIVIEAE